MIELSAILFILLSTGIGATGSIFLKLGSEKFALKLSMKGLMMLVKNWKLILGVFLYMFSTVFFIALLKKYELSLIYPMTALSYVFVSILSVWILKEKMHFYKVLGIGFIILGVVMVNL